MGCGRYVHNILRNTLTVVPQHMEPSALLAVTDAKIADMLVGKPAGVHVDELSKQSGLDAGKLGRILRALATKHCFQEGKLAVCACHRATAHLGPIPTCLISDSGS
jgi:hypothetical protein